MSKFALAPVSKKSWWKTAPPVAMEPERSSGPSYQARIVFTKAKGDSVPACPPAPHATAIRPSAPFSTAFLANLSLMTS